VNLSRHSVGISATDRFVELARYLILYTASGRCFAHYFLAEAQPEDAADLLSVGHGQMPGGRWVGYLARRGKEMRIEKFAPFE
jgi:hypothetical protein